MDENVKRKTEVDRLISLPDSLIFQILLKLSTKDVVKTSVLSSQWRNLWKNVPSLELDRSDFPDFKSFVSFVDSFLDFNRESPLEKFKLDYTRKKGIPSDTGPVKRWINTVAKQKKVQHFHIFDTRYYEMINMPPTIYSCESLVSLKLCDVVLPSPDLVTLPSLKVMHLFAATFADNLALEKLISHCPVLESLWIKSCLLVHSGELRVCSQSLLSFMYAEEYSAGVAIDAPRLEYLSLGDYKRYISVVNSLASLVKVDIDADLNLGSEKKVDPNDVSKRDMIRKFLLAISGVKEMIISSRTLEALYYYSKCEPLPLFRNLSSLRVDFWYYNWELLPFFLESCPNLKSLVVGSKKHLDADFIDILPRPWCLLASLEYIEIERPLIGEEMEIELVGYLLEKSLILKKLTLSLDASREEEEESAILRELIALPRLSSMCQVVIR